MVKQKDSEQKLKEPEQKCKDFIKLAFDLHTKQWKDTAERLLDAYKGKYYQKAASSDRFTHNTMFGLVNLMLPNFMFYDPYIQVKPAAPSSFVETPDGVKSYNTYEQAKVMEAVINKELKEIDAFEECKKALQDVFFYGVGIVKVGYSFETVSNQDEDVVVKDNCFVKRVHPLDFGWHPMATDSDNSTKSVHRIYIQKDELKNYDFFDKAAIKKIDESLPDHMKKRLSEKSNGKQTIDKFCTLYEVHDQSEGMYYYYGGEQQLYLGKKKRAYDFKGSDFVVLTLAKDTDEFVGIPLLSMVEDEAEAMNDIMTLMVDHARKFPGQVFVEEGNIDTDNIEAIRNLEQGSIHSVRDINAIKLTNPLSMGQDYFSILNMLIKLMDRSLGIPDYARLTSTTRKSATESNFIQGDATVRRNYYLQIIKSFYIKVIQRVCALKQQFVDEKEVILANGDLNAQFMEYSKEDIQGRWTFEFDIDNMAAINQGDVNNMINMLNTMSNSPVLQPILSALAPLKIGKALFKKVNLNLESFLMDNPENQIHVNPARENEIARSDAPMPQPKKGENYEEHLTTHIEDLKTNGPNDQILQHIVDTMLLAKSENKMPAKFTELARMLGADAQPQPPEDAAAQGGTPPQQPEPTGGPQADMTREAAPMQQPPQ